MKPYNPFDTNYKEEIRLIQSIVDLLPNPVLITAKTNNHIIAANPPAQSLLGIDPSTPQPLQTVFPEIDFQITANSKISAHTKNAQDFYFLEIKTFFDTYFLINLIEESALTAKKDDLFFWDDINSILETVKTSSDVFNSPTFWQACQKFTEADTLLVYLEDQNAALTLHHITNPLNLTPPTHIDKQDALYFHTPMHWKKNHINFANIQTSLYDTLSTHYTQIFNYYVENIGCFFALYQTTATSNVAEKMNFILNLLQIAQKQPELKIENSIEKKIIENSKNSYLILDQRKNLIDLNQAALTFLGFKSKQDLLHKRFSDFFITNIDLNRQLAIAKDSDSPVHSKEVRLSHRSGDVLPIELTIIPHTDHFNRFSNYIILINDLSVIATLRQQAQLMQEQAEIGNTITLFSHEVNNTLNNLTQLNNELFYYDELAEFHPHFERMNQQIDHFSDIIDNILFQSRNHKYQKKSLDIVAFLQNILKDLNSKLTANDIQVDQHFPSHCPPIYADHTAMHEVFTNLIINAIHAMTQPHVNPRILNINVIHQPQAKNILIDIADTGIGIPKQHQAKIFKQVFTTKKQGNGLGLTRTKKIITDHQGHISFTSAGNGTIFHIELPKFDKTN